METKRIEELYQKAVAIVNGMIPEEWEKVLFYSEVTEGFSQVSFYYYAKTRDKPVYSLDIVERFGLDRRNFNAMKRELYDCFEELWNEFRVQGQEPWTQLSYILDSTGQLNINYNYEDVSQISPVEKKHKWEAEYLGIYR